MTACCALPSGEAEADPPLCPRLSDEVLLPLACFHDATEVLLQCPWSWRQDTHSETQCTFMRTTNLQWLSAPKRACTVLSGERTFDPDLTFLPAAATFSWGIALAPLSLVFLVLGGIWMRRWHRHRTGKAYGLTTLKTGHQDVQSYSSKIKEIK